MDKMPPSYRVDQLDVEHIEITSAERRHCDRRAFGQGQGRGLPPGIRVDRRTGHPGRRSDDLPSG